MTDHYDVIIIGCGTGGYNTAIRAAQLGLTVACIERTPNLGGTGVHTGCIPSRVLLHASEMYDTARKGRGAALGVESVATLNLARMMAYKTAMIDGMSRSAHALLRRQRVTFIQGNAHLSGPGKVVVKKVAGREQTLSGANIVIATGSEPLPFPAAGFDHPRILDSADALSLDRVPKHLAIVGAGAVGVELGSIWRRLGARVTLIERRDRICPWLDRDVAAALQRALRRQGIGIRLSAEVVGLDVRRDGVRIQLHTSERTGSNTIEAELVLVAIGRRPATSGLNLESVGLQVSENGALPRRGPTMSAPGIWSVGDATTGPMLVSKAEEEAIACAEQIAGLPGFVDYSAIPNVLHTSPEVAMIGRTECELQDAGIEYRVGYFPLTENARAIISGKAEGFVKLLVDAHANLILGAHLIGPGSTDLISEVAVAMESSMICEDIARTCHPYPTWAEALRQAAMAAGGWMMHA